MASQLFSNGRQWRTAGLALLAGAALVFVPHSGVCASPPAVPIPVRSVVSSGPFTLTARIDSRVPEGQPASLMLALRNIGSTEQSLGDGSAFEKSAFDFTVTDEKGQAVPKTVRGVWTLTPPIVVVYANGTVSVKPGQTLRYRFNLARLFDLSRPGIYIVSAQRRLVSYPFPPPAPKPGVLVLPNQTSLTIGPLKFQMEEAAAAQSGSAAYVPAPPSSEQAVDGPCHSPAFAR